MRRTRSFIPTLAIAALALFTGAVGSAGASAVAPGYDGNVTAQENPTFKGWARVFPRCGTPTSDRETNVYCTYRTQQVQCFTTPCEPVRHSTGIYTYSFGHKRWFTLASLGWVYAWPAQGNGWSWIWTQRLGWTMSRSEHVGITLQYGTPA